MADIMEKKMIEGACHCGAVRFTLPLTPEWLTSCNCSYCRRSRGLWAYGTVDQIKLTYDPDAVIRYIWGDKMLATISCKVCGCTTHWESLDPENRPRMGVNAAMADPASIAGIRIRRFDGAESWTFLD
jgi:hypothetical protein